MRAQTRAGWVAVACGALASFAVLPARAADLSTAPASDVPPPPPPFAPAPAPAPTSPGTAPPPPPAGTPGAVAPGSTAARLADSDAKDSGVGFHLLYIRPSIGVGYATIGDAGVSGQSGSFGPSFGIAGGAELIAVQIGGFFQTIHGTNFDLTNAGAEVAYTPISGRLVQHFGLALGYAWASSLNQDKCACLPPTDIHGFDLGARIGMSYFITSSFDIGATFGLDALFLSYKSAPVVGNGAVTSGSDQSTTGALTTLQAHLGWHWP